MYELEQGTDRLITALSHIRGDAPKVQRLASVLNYIPSQLEEDIQALQDWHSKHLKEGEEDL